ncbi:MAG: N-acetyltransferase family protein [Halodesulfurarchaeum sp.]
MSEDRQYPAEVAGPFPSPPRTITDGDDREIELLEYDGHREALIRMYDDFDPADRAQGIPPVGRERIDNWLDHLLGEDSYNVIARHGDGVVGHATLVGDEEGSYELAIFVHQDYQGAGIGTELLETLLGYGVEQGVKRVWLTVERWNRPAINLYKKVGFETSDAQSFEHEMSIRLDRDD